MNYVEKGFVESVKLYRDIEDVCHWLQRCPKFHSLRANLCREMASKIGNECWDPISDSSKTVVTVAQACQDRCVCRLISSLWRARF